MPENLDKDGHYDFSQLVYAGKDSLLILLAEAHTALANLHIRIAFLRQEEHRGQQHAKVERLEYEGVRDGWEEKKWLILRLLEYKHEQP